MKGRQKTRTRIKLMHFWLPRSNQFSFSLFLSWSFIVFISLCLWHAFDCMSVCPNICMISFSNTDISSHITDTMISPNFLLQLQHYNYLVLTPLTTLQHHQKIYVFFLPLFFIQMFQGQSRDRPMLVNQLWRICVLLVAISQSNQFKSSFLFYQQDSLHSRVHKIQWKFKHKVLDV